MKHILYEDLYELRFLSDLKAAPDGKHLVFSLHRADQEENTYHSELWLADTDTRKLSLLAARGDCRNAVWLDDTRLLFTSSRDKDQKKTAEKKDREKEETIVYRISIAGGEAEKYMTIPAKGSLCAALGEDRYLFLAQKKVGPDAEVTGEDGFYVLDELPFWFNGKGVTNKLRSTLMIYSRKTDELTACTPEYFQTDSYALSPDKTKLLYTGAAYGEKNGKNDMAPRGTGLYLYQITDGTTRTMIDTTEASIGNPAFFNEEQIFYTRMTYEFVGRNPYYHIYDLTTGEDRELPFDGLTGNAAVSSTVGTDAAYGGVTSLLQFSGSLFLLQTIWNHSRLSRLEADGTMTLLSDEPGAIRGFAVTEKGIWLNAFREQHPNELYLLTENREELISHFHEDYCNNHEILRPEYFTWESKNGYTMEGFVILPAGFRPGHSYPGILEMHGGPKVVFGDVFHHEMQCLAQKGYFVFYTNPRGSDGRGEDFANITGQLGGIDYDDFMEFTDEVLMRYPELDPERIGICGGSYGGFMCNWMIGHTDRFAAAASQRSISNYFTKSLCTDIGFSHNMAQLGTTPWEDFETVWEHSPLKEASKAKTPTLFIQSDEDYRCWMSDAVQMYSALKRNGTPTRLVLFHGENHELSRSGKPENRITRLREIGDWFDTWLKR